MKSETSKEKAFQNMTPKIHPLTGWHLTKARVKIMICYINHVIFVQNIYFFMMIRKRLRQDRKNTIGVFPMQLRIYSFFGIFESIMHLGTILAMILGTSGSHLRFILGPFQLFWANFKRTKVRYWCFIFILDQFFSHENNSKIPFLTNRKLIGPSSFFQKKGSHEYHSKSKLTPLGLLFKLTKRKMIKKNLNGKSSNKSWWMGYDHMTTQLLATSPWLKAQRNLLKLSTQQTTMS